MSTRHSLIPGNETGHALLLKAAHDFIYEKISYQFTTREKMALMSFFTNGNKRVFFVHNLPTSIASALLAMYSRLKNDRGMRGHFVDNLLPILLCSFLSKFQNLSDSKEDLKKITDYIKENKLNSLDKFCEADLENEMAYVQFLQNSRMDTGFMKKLASSPKISAFLGMYLDSYGHNSIARTANLMFGLEDISVLAAKSLEWGRPGVGYIELSTRYVDFSKNSQYPIEHEFEILDSVYGTDFTKRIEVVIRESVHMYQQLVGEKFDGILPKFFEGQFKGLVDDSNLRSGVIGETCDVAANVLPCSTLTSLGISVSGEAFPELIKHLILDGTYENQILAELILEEAEKVGGSYFARHLDLSDWRRINWKYLDHQRFKEADYLVSRRNAQKTLQQLFSQLEDYYDYPSFRDVVRELKCHNRSPHDKLPSQFEFINAGFARKMSFRSWRDIQRHGFCAHLRTMVTPKLGFYHYDKPAPKELLEMFEGLGLLNVELWDLMEKYRIPEAMRQYPMAMGNLVGFDISGNLLQWEFLNWQRTKFSVNHEVRQIVLSIERVLRETYPWWSEISRADMTSAYVCARGNIGVPLSF